MTSSAVVGSSASSSEGLLGQGEGDHGALPQSAGELVGIAVHPPRGSGTPARSSRSTTARRTSARGRPSRRRISPTC
ncbi:hypothetical protein ACFQX6_00565 [Streptosporangium lutulentum]